MDTKTKLYLVTTLIEQSDEPATASHTLYANFADAKKAMQNEVTEGMKDFTAYDGWVIIDINNLYEWRDYSRENALTVIIETLNVN